VKLLAIFSVVILFGCATLEEKPNIEKRIVYCNLAPEPEQLFTPPKQPVTSDKKPTIEKKPKLARKPVKKKPEIPEAPRYFIEFTNESATKFNKEMFRNFVGSTPKEAAIMVVGHSHGISSKGNKELAIKRTETIRRQLIKQGFKDVYTMASWGRKALSAPTRGALLFVLHLK
jgi:hypothetical protein